MNSVSDREQSAVPLAQLAATQSNDQAADQSSEISLEDALLFAIGLHRSGELDGAEKLYHRIIEVAPDQPDALHFLGVLTHQRGKSEAALALIQKSIELAPEAPSRHNNLGNVLVEMGRLDEAANAYRQSINLWPEHADAYSNLGTVLKAQRRFDDAAEAYQKAIELNPTHANAFNNMGNLLSSHGKTREAVAYYCKALTVTPNHPESRRLLAIAHYTLEEVDEAAKIYRQWLEEEPNNPVAKHMLAACSGQDIPPRASDEYIEETFDKFADSFDAKLERLAYRAPQLIADAVARVAGAPEKRFIALDAGCGTGLCGPLITSYVRRLIGVDLSSQMLAKAEVKNVYDELVKAELVAYLHSHPSAYDLIVSADTLVYFGPLEEVMAAAHAAMQEGGLLLFTIETVADEATDGGSYRINPHGRYSHGRAYVSQALSAAGFDALAIELVELRMEGGKPVNGVVVTARKGNGASERKA
jgi:predicted TPR repeat methyltransferase